ncbi:MAG: OmcA/MtrC family decaheme c-type cytochrome [Proteobacteria bacterium]|nr:OmcA/MtrC family decaheme c-type cytochrome [Pseudomonadota bacterium]
MTEHRSLFLGIDLVPGRNLFRGFALALLALVLTACGGGNSGSNAVVATTSTTTPASAVTGATALAAAGTLNMSIVSAAVNSPPVLNFVVTNEAGVGMAGLTSADLRFAIAKLTPAANGGPATWQSYINSTVGGAVQAGQERSGAGFVYGTLVDRRDGTYTYTFATDIKNVNCPAPCADAEGKPLDISFQPGATHRITVEQANAAYPRSAGALDFVPSGAAGAKRDIVSNAACNQCHGQFTAHGSIIGANAQLCVTCHNGGTWVAGTPNTPVDFKIMVHKIHYNKASTTGGAGTALPSVVAGTPYKINGIDFSKVRYPQDVRNCTKCHDGTAGSAIQTAQGDNWKKEPSIEACGACHDNVYFSAKADAAKPYQTKAHSGGVQADNSACALCHAAGKFTDKKDIVVAHKFATTLVTATAKFKYNIISATPTTAGSKPVITFSVTDPTNADKPYDIKADKPFLSFAAGGPSRLFLSIGWNTTDINNDTSGQDYGQPVSIDLLNNAAVVAGATAGTYTVTSTTAIPAGQTGTLRVMMDGHPAGDVTTAGTFTDRLKVTSVFKDFVVTGTATARRLVVDVAKCNVCHGVLSLHGNNRTDEPGVCVVCHNPNATDRTQRITAGAVGEESIDFKTMIHGIHAGQASNGGFRTTGITIYGFGGSKNDFSTVVFPGKLSNCTACHTTASYQLTGTWETPTAKGILGTTVSTGASPTLSTDNLRNSPTAAVCSSCHDGALAKSHMQDAFNGAKFSVTQATITEENCSFCHGVGRANDVKTAHKVQ